MSLQLDTSSLVNNHAAVSVQLSNFSLVTGQIDYTININGYNAGYLDPNLWDLVGLFLVVLDNDYRRRVFYLDYEGIDLFFRRTVQNQNGNEQTPINNLLLSYAKLEAAKRLNLPPVLPSNTYAAPVGDFDITVPFIPGVGQHNCKLYGIYNVCFNARKVDAVEKLPINLPFTY